MSQIPVKLVSEFFSVNRSSSPASTSWISALNHEVRDNSMEHCVVVVSSTRELSKVSAGVWSVLPVKFYRKIAKPEVLSNFIRLFSLLLQEAFRLQLTWSPWSQSMAATACREFQMHLSLRWLFDLSFKFILSRLMPVLFMFAVDCVQRSSFIQICKSR
jgi:hypothetical protein